MPQVNSRKSAAEQLARIVDSALASRILDDEGRTNFLDASLDYLTVYENDRESDEIEGLTDIMVNVSMLSVSADAIQHLSEHEELQGQLVDLSNRLSDIKDAHNNDSAPRIPEAVPRILSSIVEALRNLKTLLDQNPSISPARLSRV